jgi:hypothetical protein
VGAARAARGELEASLAGSEAEIERLTAELEAAERQLRG